jgi:hypothetical protein
MASRHFMMHLALQLRNNITSYCACRTWRQPQMKYSVLYWCFTASNVILAVLIVRQCAINRDPVYCGGPMQGFVNFEGCVHLDRSALKMQEFGDNITLQP